MSGRFSTKPIVDYDPDVELRAQDIAARGALLVKAGYLPSDYTRTCWNLKQHRVIVEEAETVAAACEYILADWTQLAHDLDDADVVATRESDRPL